MSENPTASGSSVRGRAGLPGVFDQALPIEGPATVINPERRGFAGDSSGSRGTGSSIWTRLFPHDSSPPADMGIGPVGCRLGHFLIEATIGSGGMGAVFRAVDERLDRTVALKVLSPALSKDPASVQRFVNEARAAARLDHENIARVYFVGEDQGLNFIAHEFVTGRNIRDLIRDQGPLNPREAVSYTLQLTTALRHTAAAGVVHRDIKPSNVIVTPRGRAKLVDLGLAKKVASESLGDLTIAGTTLGTFDYISPEQAKDPRNVDVRSDIYSLGCTLYHMLAGAPPYAEGTVLQKLLDHQAKDVPDPAKKNPRVPAALSAVVRRMMAPEPRDRYSSPDELLRDLLPIAAAMGLRGINPDALVWTNAPAARGSFLERNISWIAAAAALFVIAFLFDRFSHKPHDLAGRARGGTELAANANVAPATPEQDSGTARVQEKSPPAPAKNSPSEKGAAKAVATTGEKPAEGLGGKIPMTFPSDPELVFDPPIRSPADSNTGSLVRATEPKVVPSPGAADTDPQRQKGTAAPSSPGISIAENGSTTNYPTLESAVADAKDGSIVELRFNGLRTQSEKPFRVSGKRVTIRGAKGFHPVILFSPRELPATGYESRMISLNNGGLDLFDVDIHAVVPETFEADHWSLFSLGGPDRLRLHRVNITVVNPGNRQAQVVDISSSRDQFSGMPVRSNGPMGSPQEFEIEVVQSFVRGGCGLFAVRTTEGGRVEMRQSVAATQGPLLVNFGDDETVAEGRRLNLRIEHVTCFLTSGLLQFDGGSGPRNLVPLDVSARNNIFASKSQSSLISVAGRTSDEADFRRLIRWEGVRNFYDRFASYWGVNPAAGAAANPPLQLEDWKHLLGDTEVDANNNGIVWKSAWQGKPSAAIKVADFELANLNQAINGASDYTDVGADLSVIRAVPEPPATP